MKRLSDNFDTLSSKIGPLLYTKTVVDKNAVAQLLDDFNSLNYHMPLVESPTKAVLLVNQFCTALHPDDEVLAPKCAQFISKLLTTGQNVIVEGRTMTFAIQWCLEAIRAQVSVLDFIKALEALIRNNAQNMPSSLLDAVWTEIEIHTRTDSKVIEDVLLASVKCLEASTVATSADAHENLFSHLERCASLFTSLLFTFSCQRPSIVRNKILESCLVGLKNIIVVHDDYLCKELGLILGLIKSYMVYGIEGIDYLNPEKLVPQTLNIPEVVTVVKERIAGKVVRQRRQRPNRKKEKKAQENGPSEFGAKPGPPLRPWLDYRSDNDSAADNSMTSLFHRLKTSDSDFSDTEGGNKAKLQHSSNRIRQAALNLFAEVRSDKATVFTYWFHFIPERLSLGKHNLVSCILRDPSPRGKICALNVLLLMVSSAKQYLGQAEYRENVTSSFTPFSVMLGLTLVELHRSLCLALTNQFPPILAQSLKCLAALVQATPYHKMPKGLVTKVVRNVKMLTKHKDVSVQVTSLIVIGCLLALDTPVAETEQAVIRIEKTPDESEPRDPLCASEDFDFAQFSSEDEEEVTVVGTTDTVPWLLQTCLANLRVGVGMGRAHKDVPTPVKLECLHIFTVMSTAYFESMILPLLDRMTEALANALVDKYPDVVLHACRTVVFFGEALNKCRSPNIDQFKNFWLALLGGPLMSVVENEQQPMLRSAGCDCIGSIGPRVFPHLPRDKQILCVTMLFSRVQDEDSMVKGAASRALALCANFPPFNVDGGFVADVADAVLRVLGDDNLNARAKASWALGSLSDSLIISSKLMEEALPDKLLLRLMEAGVKGSKDNERVSMNVVRALGNLTQLLDENLLADEQFAAVLMEALEALERSSVTGTNMKVRWNACYALATALKNCCIFAVCQPNGWSSRVLMKLAQLVINFKNFKVRIHAAAALSAPSKREHYGECFVPVWTAMLQGLETSQNIDVLSEYKHRDQLVEQICLCLGHLTKLLTRDDLPQLERSMTLYFDLFKTHTHKITETLVPERSTDLLSAASHLNALAEAQSHSSVSSSERKVIDSLKAVFVVR